MGYQQRVTMRLEDLMTGLSWINRIRVWLVFARTPTMPTRLKGWAGLKWILTGQVAKRTAR